MAIIETYDLVKRYKNGKQALNGFNMSVAEGEIFSLLGPNGAGKSTLINILTTYLKPTSGKILIQGMDLNCHADEVRCIIACVAQQLSIDTHLSLTDNMLFQSQLYKIPKQAAIKRMNELINAFDLAPFKEYAVSSYSGGVKRRLDVALNMMSNPKILFLDEPTVGMDVCSRRQMWQMMRKIRDEFKTTIFLTTHYLEEAENLSDTICIMKEGKALIQDSPQALRAVIHQEYLQIQFDTKQTANKYLNPFRQCFANQHAMLNDAAVMLHTQNSHFDMEKALSLILTQKIPCLGIQIVQPSLEDVFVRLTAEQEAGK